MKNHKYCTTFFLFLIVWSYTAEAMSPYKVLPMLEMLKDDLLDDLQPDSSVWSEDSIDVDSSEEQFTDNSLDLDDIHRISKRDAFFEKPIDFLSGALSSLTKSKDVLNLCAAASGNKIFCVLNSMITESEHLKHLLYVLPSTTGIMCLLANTVFSSMPQKVNENKDSTYGISQFLKLFDVKPSDQADFAKSAANALIVSLIKNLKGKDFDDLRPLVDNLETMDNKKRGRTSSLGSMSTIFPNFQWDSMGKGSWINSKCKNMEATSPSSILADVLRKQPCIADSTLPGYFVFNKLPATAWTKPILPILRAWNSPLLAITGAKCCMIPFAEKSKRLKCNHKYQLLEKPHGLPEQNGPTRVCGAIDDFMGKPVDPPSLVVDPNPCDYPEFQLMDYGAGNPCATDKPLEMPDVEYTSEELGEPVIEVDPEYNLEDLKSRSGDMMYYDSD
ncbi:hypothetical protein Ocin01_06207 [Orchesella cincta]|uniref:Uncharacterized protein n=1 Tax=Orchesella cincta TaxID=48709 RepID=A0A1D2N597_ORCCI|nr:hypothetical protein Ocin01_06207 [Orchesella cincta]